MRRPLNTQLQAFARMLLLASLLTIITTSCGIGTKHPTSSNPSRRSLATGAQFNAGGDSFQVHPFKKQAQGPGMVFIEGGMTTMGFVAERSPLDPSPYRERTVSVASFYIADTATTNLDWREYLHDLQINGLEEEYNKALPDQEVWKRALAFNDDLVKNYLRGPGFNYYPVVGVSWTQACAYCEWRTRAVNKLLAQKAKQMYDPEVEDTHLIETGIAVAGYRLPTEAEWERAARGMDVGKGNVLQSSQRAYAWDGLSLRGQKGAYKGQFLANFKRGPGNYKGFPGENDSNGATCSVYDYPPTEEGVHIGHGNVREWVYDLYRPLSSQDFEDFNPVRRDDTLDPQEGYDSRDNCSLIDNKVRVIKGCAWKDCGYWLQISTRRYMDQEAADAMTGFRCAMTSVGSTKQ